jgi:hypothetical protein
MTTGSSLTGAGSLQGDLEVGAAFLERLSLRTLPPGQLTTTLLHLIEHGTGAAAYYADVTEAVVALAVEAPCGPPPARLISCPGWIRAWPPVHRKSAPWPKSAAGRWDGSMTRWATAGRSASRSAYGRPRTVIPAQADSIIS